MEEFREGFTVVHSPPLPAVPTADIVFVHGLGGGPNKTWKSTAEPRPEPPKQEAPTNTSAAQSRSPGLWAWGFHRQHSEDLPSSNNPEQVFWPKDFLAVDIPEARILTYGYDSEVTKGYTPSSKSGIFALSRNLLYKLERERPLGRPIIFVAHSLGGIITKEVLRRSESSEEQEFQDIVNSTKAVIFFGTPHRGSTGFANFGALVRRVAEKTLRVDANSSILRALGDDQPELELSRSSFTKQWMKFGFLVKTFQEDYGLSGINVSLLNEKVVPDTSSLLDDEREHPETIRANHIEMCKFSSRKDPGYTAVCAEIRKVLGRLVRQGQQFTKHQEESFLKSLHFSTMYDRTMDIAEALKDTCDWLFALPEYRYWIEGRASNDSSDLLWIKGKPGTGKSTLMKEFLHRTKLSADPGSATVAAFFFNGKATDSLEKTQLGLYRSILHQILQTDLTALCRSIPGYLQKARTERLENDEVRWHREELQKLLLQSYRDPGLVPVFILVDALDECSRDEVRHVVTFFRRLIDTAAQAGNSVKVCFSSRHYPDLGNLGCSEIHVEENNTDDIIRYIQHQARDISVVEDLQEDLVRKASNVFLWVVLAIGILDRRGRGQSVKARRKLLAKLPPELSTLFRDLFVDLEDDERPEALLLFQLTLFATRPLTLAQIICAICFGSENPPESLAQLKESEHYVAEEEQSNRITVLSRGLIEVPKMSAYDHETGLSLWVQLVHESVRDFFLYENGFASLFGSDMPATEIVGRAHSSIARSCANCLVALKAKERFMDKSPRHPFETYAVNEVLGYVDRAEASGISQTETLYKLRDSQGNRAIDFGSFWFPAACRKGLVSCASKFIELGADVNATDYLGYTPLQNACDTPFGDLSTVLLLLRHGADPNDAGEDGHPPLMLTSHDDDQLELTDALLEHGADPNSMNSEHITALFMADPLSAKRLIRAGALVNARDRQGGTVIHRIQSVERLNLLLTHGADASATDNRGRRPIHFLDDSPESFETVEILIRYGANPNVQDASGETPLHYCVSKGFPIASMALIRAGASVNIQDQADTPVLSAAFCAKRSPQPSPEILTTCCIIIAAGADLSSKDRDGKSPADIWEERKIELQTSDSEQCFSPESIEVVTWALKIGRCPELLDSMMSLPKKEMYNCQFDLIWWRVVCSFYAGHNEE